MPARRAISDSDRLRCRSSNVPITASTRDATDAPGADVLPAICPILPLSGSLAFRAAPHGDTVAPMTTVTQADISAEIKAIDDEYHRAGLEEFQPRLDYSPYRSSLLRHPTKDLLHADPESVGLWAPCF